MPPLVQAALLGVVQGITEFLPVSSTAHLLIVSRIIGFNDPGGVFTVMIQLGSILAVAWLYRDTLLKVLVGLPSDRRAQRFALLIFLAFVPAVLAGALLSGFVKSVLYYSLGVMAASFIIGGIVMLVIERVRPAPSVHASGGGTPGRSGGGTPEWVNEMPFARALGIGICQTLALVPGVSRSGATIVGGMVAGLDRRAAAEFSFFLAIPTMTAAFAHDLLEVRGQLSTDRALEIAVGFVMAFLASALVVKPFLNFVSRSGFAPFAWYRIVAGLALLAALAAGLA